MVAFGMPVHGAGDELHGIAELSGEKNLIAIAVATIGYAVTYESWGTTSYECGNMTSRARAGSGACVPCSNAPASSRIKSRAAQVQSRKWVGVFSRDSPRCGDSFDDCRRQAPPRSCNAFPQYAARLRIISRGNATSFQKPLETVKIARPCFNNRTVTAQNYPSANWKRSPDL